MAWVWRKRSACGAVCVLVLSCALVAALPTGEASAASLDALQRRELGRAALSLLLYMSLAAAIASVARHWRRRWRQLLVAAGSVLLVALGFELALRATEAPAGRRAFYAASSRRLHHTHPPNRKMFAGVFAGQRVFVDTNEDGLRTPHSRASFRAHGTRIALIGDSYVFGFLVPEEQAVAHQLERGLRGAWVDPDVAVLNAGIISASPLTQRRLFDEVVRHYEPQLVLLLLDASDIGDDHAYAGQLVSGEEDADFDVRDGGAPVPRPGLLGVLRPVIGLLHYPVELLERGPSWPDEPRHFSEHGFRVEIDGVVEDDRFFIYRHPLAKTRPYFEATLHNIRALAKSVRETGAEFRLIVVPRFHHWNKTESPENWEARFYRRDEPYQFELFRFFEEADNRADLPTTNLLEAFRKTREFPLVFRSDPHWNAAGHAFVARTLAASLRRSPDGAARWGGEAE